MTQTTTAHASPSAATAILPSPFASRYEIRRLTEEDITVATAIVILTNVMNSPVWSVCYPHDKAQRCYDGLEKGEYLARHQIMDGHSFGVFDTHYQCRTDSAAAAGGAVHWDTSNKNATAEELDAQIDSPMVSVALSYDAHNTLDMARLMPLLEVLPLYGAIFHRLDITDPRDPPTFTATARGQILKRNATSTRLCAEGRGVTKKMANWLMEYAREQGYGFINIECFSEAVHHIWTTPSDTGMRGDCICAFHTEDYTEVDDQGRIILPFGDARQRLSRVYVALDAK